MGVDTSLYVGAKAHFRPTCEQLEALIDDLLKRDFVQMPCAIMVGKGMRLDVPPSLEPPLWFRDNDLFHARNDWPVKRSYAEDFWFDEEEQKPEDVLVYYAGQSEQILRATLRELDVETQDVCIFFSGLTFDHGETWEGREVFIFSQVQPSPLICENAYASSVSLSKGEEHFLQYVVNIEGRYGIWEIDGTPLEPILIHHLGPNLVVDCTFA